jgi:DNA-binding PadR family transcriptional regulator
MARRPKLGPSSDPELLILMSLAESPKHGYSVMQDVEKFAGVKLGPGTLYTAISRLVEKGKIKPDQVADRQRPYRITKSGLESLAEQIHAMRKIVNVGVRRLSFS